VVDSRHGRDPVREAREKLRPARARSLVSDSLAQTSAVHATEWYAEIEGLITPM
jgi:hypothetical protein